MIYGDNPQDPLGLNIYVPDINAIAQSTNLYAYCINNPIMYVDLNGESILLIVGGIIIGAVISAAVDASCQIIFQGARSWDELDKISLIVSAVGGAASGGLGASAVKLTGQIVGNMAISTAQTIAYDKVTGSKTDYMNLGLNTMLSGLFAGFAGPGLQSSSVVTMKTLDNIHLATVVTQTFKSSRQAETFKKEFIKNVPTDVVYEIIQKGVEVTITVIEGTSIQNTNNSIKSNKGHY